MIKSTLEKAKAPVVLPVGGEDENNFNYQEVWYPVFFVEDLDKNIPNSFTLLEEDIVIWWEEKNYSMASVCGQMPPSFSAFNRGKN